MARFPSSPKTIVVDRAPVPGPGAPPPRQYLEGQAGRLGAAPKTTELPPRRQGLLSNHGLKKDFGFAEEMTECRPQAKSLIKSFERANKVLSNHPGPPVRAYIGPNVIKSVEYSHRRPDKTTFVNLERHALAAADSEPGRFVIFKSRFPAPVFRSQVSPPHDERSRGQKSQHRPVFLAEN